MGHQHTPTDEEKKLKLQKMKFENMKLLGEVVKVWLNDFGKLTVGTIFVISLIVNGGHIVLKFFDSGLSPKIEMSYPKSNKPNLGIANKLSKTSVKSDINHPKQIIMGKSRKLIEGRNMSGGAFSLILFAWLIMWQIKSRRKKNG